MENVIFSLFDLKNHFSAFNGPINIAGGRSAAITNGTPPLQRGFKVLEGGGSLGFFDLAFEGGYP